MPVIVLEARDFTSPLSLVRTWALLAGCLTFSLVASLDPSELAASLDPSEQALLSTFWILCMFTWCLFFILTLLIHVLSVIQFHSLIPVSWKNLTVTVAALAALMVLSASVIFPGMIVDHEVARPRPMVATVASCLTFLAYASEAFLIRTQSREQRGYMASAPGLLKVLQFWGGCQMIPLFVEGARRALLAGDGKAIAWPWSWWQLWVSGVVYAICLVMSLGTVAVVLGDWAGRCLVPFDRLLAGFSLTGVLLYVVATILCFTRVLRLPTHCKKNIPSCPVQVVMETVVASVTLLAYTVDLAFSVKLLRDRSHP
ncbi:myeloid-associated differentiation marker-like [Osmerus mordax]|uniref:myeloid-associated differentiation marker-like n=1 Tax=Osmerus mordax TaxID=8014 RepID=UPI00350FAE2C